MFHDSVFFEAVPMRSTMPFSQNSITTYGIPTQHGYYSSSNLLGYNNHLATLATGAAAMSAVQQK